MIKSSIYTADDCSEEREEEERKRKEIYDTYRNAPYEEIVARSEAKVMIVYIIYPSRTISVFYL